MGKKKREKSREERKRKEAKQERINRIRKIALLALAVVIGLSIISLITWQLLRDISFEEAMVKPELRDSYIEKIVGKIGKPTDVTINYIDTPEEVEFLKKEMGYSPKPGDLMTIHLGEISLDMLGKQSLPARISVFPFAFSGEIIKTEDDSIGALRHEYHHINNMRSDKIGLIGISTSFLTKEGKFNKNLAHDVDEIDTFRIDLSTQANLSPEYRARGMRRYLDYYTNIWDHSDGMDFDFIKKIKIEFFEEWMLSRPELIKEAQNWYFRDATGRKYHFSPDEVSAIRQKWQR